MPISMSKYRPSTDAQAGWRGWKPLEPFTKRDKFLNADSYLRTRLAIEAGTWQPGEPLLLPKTPPKMPKKPGARKRMADEVDAPCSAPAERPKRACRKSSRLLAAEADGPVVESEGEPARKKQKTAPAPPAPAKPPLPTPPPTTPPEPRAAKRMRAAPKMAAGQPYSERELAHIHILKTEPGKSRSWKDIARYLNALQLHKRSAGAFQASYSREMAKATRGNGGVVPVVFTAEGPHAPVPAVTVA